MAEPKEDAFKLSDIKLNPSNPRTISDDKFQKLVNSIREFPKMMELRPMVIDSNSVVLGGNQRLKALRELGYTEVPNEWVKSAEELTEDEQRRFIIADNVGFGEHDWDVLNLDWDSTDLENWGMDIPKWEDEKEQVDLSDKIEIGFKIEINCSGEEEQEQLYNEFLERGIECRLLTL